MTLRLVYYVAERHPGNETYRNLSKVSRETDHEHGISLFQTLDVILFSRQGMHGLVLQSCTPTHWPETNIQCQTRRIRSGRSNRPF